MELHTLGVDGGYTQKDVTEVARAFTGWTIDNPRHRRRVPLRAADPLTAVQKVVLGHEIKAGGGRATASRCWTSSRRIPSTAQFISTKLARRFVSDTPPPALIDRMAARFTETDGNLTASDDTAADVS